MTTATKGSLFIISASSGTGKTSLVKALLENIDQLAVSISHTTRQPRPAEENGVHYHFTNIDDFKAGIDQGDFLEHAEVFGNYYGTAKSSVKTLLDQGIDVILEIDWQGALQIKEMYQTGQLGELTDELNMIFILPPNRETLRERLSTRGQDSSEVIEKRLAGAVSEIQQYHHFDYLIINDDFAEALSELTAIIISKRQKLAKQQMRYKELIDGLLG